MAHQPMYRRAFVALAAAAVLAAGFALPASAAATPRSIPFQIPSAAFARPLGGPIPTRPACSAADTAEYVIDCGSAGSEFPVAQSGLGIPLGGVGADTFMINQAGTFGPWDLGDDENPEARILPQAAFHIRIQRKGKPARVTTLAASSVFGTLPSAWHGLRPGQGTYRALYPFGWIKYNGLASSVSSRFWSPIVARNDYWTSLPVAFFDMRVADPTNQMQRISVMFTFPSATDHAGKGFGGVTAYEGPATVRTGLGSRFRLARRTGVRGVTLSASSPSNTPDAADSEWTIAVRPGRGQRVSYTTSWNANGTGADVYRPFAETGALPDKPLDHSHSAGAIAVSVTLRPHQSTVIPFILSWDFPQFSEGSGSAESVWMRRYTDYFGARENSQNDYVARSYRFHQSFRIANAALSHHNKALAAVQTWWKPIANSSAYPSWLRTAALNEVNTIASDASFWEGGFVKTTDTPAAGGPRIGSQVPGTHLFFDLEGGGFADANCWDCNAYGYLMLQQLFPHLDIGLLRGWTSMIIENPDGATPHDAGSTDPWLDWSPSTVPAAEQTQYMDEPAKYIFVAYAYWRATHDASFLKFAYPAMLKTYQFLLAHVPAGDHLPLSAPAFDDTYDTWPMSAHDVYLSELLLLADQVMVAATHDAATRGVPGATTAEAQSIASGFSAAQSEFEQDFWNSLRDWYNITLPPLQYSDGTMADALFAQQLAQQVGLPDLVDIKHIVPDLLSAYPDLTQERQNGQMLGALNGVDDLGQEITGVAEANETWTGVSWFLAATLYADGTRFNNSQLTRDALALGHSLYYQIYVNQANGFTFGVPEAWGGTTTTAYRNPGYLRPRSVWDFLNQIGAPHIPGPP
jgi:uncharacterized protein (DUF608 family)